MVIHPEFLQHIWYQEKNIVQKRRAIIPSSEQLTNGIFFSSERHSIWTEEKTYIKDYFLSN